MSGSDHPSPESFPFGAQSWLTRRIIPLLALVLGLHLLLYFQALEHHSYLTDDSIQYLTLSENLQEHGVWSQSYLPPYVPDLQRSPGYPVLLNIFGNSISWILALQHLLVLVSGLILFKILALLFPLPTARWGSWIWLLQPYPILMASLVLSETLFIVAFLAGIWGVLIYFQHGKWSALVGGIVALALAAYVRPVGLPLMALLLLALFVRGIRQRKWLGFAMGVVLVPLSVLPWILANQARSSEAMFNSMGDMALIHGRLGGLEAHRQGIEGGEGTWFRLGDSLAVQEKGLQGYRHYYSTKQSHETELYRGGAVRMALEHHLRHPGAAIGFQFKSVLAMLKGVGYGWSLQLTQNQPFSYGLAIWQGLMNLLIFSGGLLALWYWKSWPEGLGWIFAMVLLLFLASAAVWADGRYRLVIDPLLIMVGGMAFQRLQARWTWLK